MRAYITRRLLLIIPTLFLVTIIVFFGLRMIPGDVIDIMEEGSSWHSSLARGAIERELGLDLPIYIQYGRWIGVIPQADGSVSGVFQGDLGDSLWGDVTVLSMIVERLPLTFELGILSVIITLIIALPIGMHSAIRQDSIGDYVSRSIATMFIALPSFWVGIMIVIFASIWLGLSPSLTPIPFTEDPLKNLGRFIVPAFVLCLPSMGQNMRMTRSTMLDVLRQDFIRTAWAKGLRERVVTIRHALKNALIPVVTMIGLEIRVVLGGAVIIERVFNLPGIGFLLVDSTNQRDYPVVTGIILVFAVFMMLVNLVVDLIYAFLDPRIRYS